MRRRRLTALGSLALLQVATLVAGLGLTALRFGAVSQPEAAPHGWPTVAAAEPVLVAADTAVAGGSRAAVARALESYLGAAALGDSVAGTVIDLRSGRTLFRRRADVPVTPASTVKIATAVAALSALGPRHRIATSVLRGPSQASTGLPSNPPDQPIFLVGGGDPTLASPEGAAASSYPQPAELADLAEATVRQLRAADITAVRLHYDASLFTGPATGPGWTSSYLSGGHVAPVSALAVDEGRIDPERDSRTMSPAAAAAERFAQLLEDAGITVLGPAVREPAPSNAARVATVESPPLSALVERMLTDSDNDLAEALARQVAIAGEFPASFAGAADAVEDVLAEFGVPDGVELADGSGLSPNNRMSAEALSELLELSASPRHPQFRPVITGLPVAGFSGTLEQRFGEPPATGGAGVVRAKTGTLNGVSSLAGVGYAGGGQLLGFAFLADEVPSGGTYRAEAALDRLAAALAGCDCG